MDMQAMMGGGPPPQVKGPAESALQHLKTALDHAQAALVSEPDDADSQQLAKVVQQLYALLANRQKESDKVMGDPGTLKAVRRAYSG